VTFDIDANGIINVSAKDLGSGNEQAITISGDKHLSDEEIEEMVNKAKDYEEEDKQKREEIEIRNNADTAIFTSEKLLKDSEDKITEDEKKSIEDAAEKVKTALENDDTETIKTETEALTEAVYAVTVRMYQEAAAEAQASGETGEPQASAQDDDSVVDADYEVQDDKKE